MLLEDVVTSAFQSFYRHSVHVQICGNWRRIRRSLRGLLQPARHRRVGGAQSHARPDQHGLDPGAQAHCRSTPSVQACRRLRPHDEIPRSHQDQMRAKGKGNLAIHAASKENAKKYTHFFFNKKVGIRKAQILVLYVVRFKKVTKYSLRLSRIFDFLNRKKECIGHRRDAKKI